MLYEHTCLEGALVRRYKRFFADVLLPNGSLVVCHCPNTGRMTGCNNPGSPVRISPACNPKRKLKWTLEQVCTDSSWIGVNTNLANRLVKEGILSGVIHELKGYDSLKPEQKYGENSRIDFLLEGHSKHQKQRCFVEVKSATMRREDDVVIFPDAITARGTKHLNELALQVKQGHRAVVVFCVQRDDCCRFEPTREIDPNYAAAFTRAREVGVEFLAYVAKLSAEEVILYRSIPA